MNALVANVMVGNVGRRENAIAGWTGARNVRKAANIAMLVAAPLIGLAFVIALPVVGLGMLAWAGVRRAAKIAAPAGRYLVNIALFLAAPFIGLAYALAFPFVGIAMLVGRAAKRAAA